MIKEIVCFKFPGFYESIFCNSGDFLDDEDELKFELEEVLGEEKIDIYYEYEDFNKYKIDVGEKFMEYHVEKIIESLPSEITDNEDFCFEKIDYSTAIDSPKYYNYRTDYCYCEIKTNKKTLEMIKKYTLKLEGANKYILRNFTSRDGFISFISNNIEYWKSLEIEEYEENMLSSLLDMLVSLSDCTAFEEISYSTLYDIDKYFYVIPTADYREKDKKLRKEGLKILREKGIKVNG